MAVSDFPAKLTAVSESAVFGIAVSGILPIDVHVLRVVIKLIAVVYDPTLQGRLRRHSYNTNTSGCNVRQNSTTSAQHDHFTTSVD